MTFKNDLTSLNLQLQHVKNIDQNLQDRTNDSDSFKAAITRSTIQSFPWRNLQKGKTHLSVCVGKSPSESLTCSFVISNNKLSIIYKPMARVSQVNLTVNEM